MTIVFVSVVLNIHQAGVADELYRLCDGNFWFVETSNPEGDNVKGGKSEDFEKRPYLIRISDNKQAEEHALQLIRTADVMVYGAAPLNYFIERVRTGKLTFLYSERWLKQGWKNFFSPNLIKQMFVYHTMCHNKPIYLLGASAYAAKDFNLMGAFGGKAYKWGYFTQCADLDIDCLLKAKSSACIINILWCGRFIDWKHPEVMISLAERLKNVGIDFQINMIGTGCMFESIRTMVNNKHLEAYIHLLGAMPNEKVLQVMQVHHIVCLTSDRNEGWGAVLNESMGNGCCPVSSFEAGSTPYLVKDGVNGFSFSLRKENDFFEKVMWLIQHKEECMKMSKEAYRTIHDVWSPKNAADNFFRLSEVLLSGNKITITNGPCSKA